MVKCPVKIVTYGVIDNGLILCRQRGRPLPRFLRAKPRSFWRNNKIILAITIKISKGAPWRRASYVSRPRTSNICPFLSKPAATVKWARRVEILWTASCHDVVQPILARRLIERAFTIGLL